ncbi:phosphoribosylanthranilate isomerase [Reinekea sp. G2M2-21]|uniref:phosphoribosylanthranilate isomerase n=1 Tax=Reinekea sp. G2M2-21 TaxID=2788942 RepID=UPI00351C3A79
MTMYHRTRIKMCGMTRPEDMQYACAAGADAVGMVFYPPSPRAVSLDIAEQLAQQVSLLVDKVLLFVNADPGYIREAVQATRADVIQFHGDETESFCEQFGQRYIKALRVKDAAQLQSQLTMHPNADAIMLDAFVEGVPGGTGQSFDWALIPEEIKSRLFLAGGLNTANVKDAVCRIKPYAVDVSGGIEMSKGVKDAAKMRSFAEQVRQADLSFNEISS